MGGYKVDECAKGNSLECNVVSKDCLLSSEDANVRAEFESVQSDYHGKETSQRLAIREKCSDASSNFEVIHSKRKSTMDERLCCNVVETSGPAKRIR